MTGRTNPMTPADPPAHVVQLGLERSGRTEPEPIAPAARADWMTDQEWAEFQKWESWAAAINGLRIDPSLSEDAP